MNHRLLACLTGVLLAFAGGCGTNLKPYEFVKPEMGTGFRIVIYAPDKDLATRAATAAWTRIEELNRILSDYDPNSELSRLSQRTLNGPMTEPVSVSADLWNVLEGALDASRRSDGAFDVTVGPMVRLWRRSRQLHQLPTTQRVEDARRSVGYQNMRLDPAHHTVQLLAARMVLDVGGIAKGYTAEEAVKVIRLYGLDRALVGAAGDLYAGKAPPARNGWRVLVEPLDPAREAHTYAQFRDYACSTSGDTERFVIIDGVRYSHIVDPTTGLGLTRRIGVTVIAPHGITADWASTAVSILGPEKGIAMIEKIPGAAVRITALENGGIKVWESSRFHKYVVDVPAGGR